MTKATLKSGARINTLVWWFVTAHKVANINTGRAVSRKKQTNEILNRNGGTLRTKAIFSYTLATNLTEFSLCPRILCKVQTKSNEGGNLAEKPSKL